jgi:hypothetical protein
MRKELTEEEFLKNIAKHEMNVLKDDGVYRHIRMKQPGSFNMWFDIVTWPGFLAYTGDMGAFVFTRLEDMFQFFRSDWINDRKDGKIRINPSYWGEKLEAVDRNGRTGSYREFSEDRFKEHVEDVITEWIQECPIEYESSEEEEAEQRKKFETELRKAVEEEVYRNLGDGEHEARRALNEFSFSPEENRFYREPHKYEFRDTWEWDCEEYTFRFTWCCYALAWSIRKYDEMKTGAL